MYGFTGSTSFVGVSAALSGELSTGALFGIVFVLVGLAFKVSAVPFHMWTPDVYEGAPTPVTAFFATAPKVAAIALTARVALRSLRQPVDAWRQIVILHCTCLDYYWCIGGNWTRKHQTATRFFIDQQRRLHSDRFGRWNAAGCECYDVVPLDLSGDVTGQLCRGVDAEGCRWSPS